MVVNISQIKNGQFDLVKEEIYQIKKAIVNKILKVIVETCYFIEVEKN